MALAVWWIYLDCMAGGAVERLARQGDTVRYRTSLYSYLPLQLCLAGVGVSVEAMVRHVGVGPAPPFVRWLAAGAGVDAVSAALFAVGAFGVLLDPVIPPFAWARDRVAGGEQTFTIPQEQTDD